MSRQRRLVIGPEPRRRAPARGLLKYLLVLALLGVAVVRLVFFELLVVRGNTMAPGILDGDVLLLEKRARPGLGDVVLLEYEGQAVLRRVLGLPGDRVGSADGVLTRNELPIATRVAGTFAYHDPTPEDTRPRRQQHLLERLGDGRSHEVLGDHVGAARPWLLELPDVEIPAGHLFVMCDNRRTCPLDERAGVVPLAWVRGVAPFVMWYGDARVEPPAEQPFYGAFKSTGSTESADVGRAPRK